MCLKSQIDQNIYNGSIEVICGSMFSGKTEELLKRLNRVNFSNLKLSVFKPQLDTRYNNKKIVSHDSNEILATAIKSPSEILNFVSKSDVIAIDEAQFFDADLIAVCNAIANKKKRVIIAGLDMDFLGKPFGIMPSLLAIADKITKLHAICSDCSDTANYSFRLTKNRSLIELGEKNEYKALCRRCFANNIS